MKAISINSHRFDKMNLMTLKNRKGMYDLYKCKDCGLEGKRYGIGSDIIMVEKDKKCSHTPEIAPQVNLGRVKMIHPHVTQFGFVVGNEYDRVPCPIEYLSKYSKDAWVYSEQRKEAVRLLDDEIEKL